MKKITLLALSFLFISGCTGESNTAPILEEPISIDSVKEVGKDLKVMKNEIGGAMEEEKLTNIEGGYHKDETSFYYKTTTHPPEMVVLEGVDSETFEVLSYGHAKDKNNEYFGVRSIGKKAVTKIFIANHLQSSKDRCYDKDFQLNNKEGDLILRMEVENWFTGSSCCPYFNRTASCLINHERDFFKDLEGKVKDEFNNVDNLTVYFKDGLAYKDDKFYYRKDILSLSEDGRYAEVRFPDDSARVSPCHLWDMKTETCLSGAIHYNEKNKKQEDIQSIKKRYSLKDDFDRSAWHFSGSKKINDEVVLFGKRVPAKQEENYDMAYRTNLNYKHEPTGVELTISTVDLDFVGLYWHDQMQGVIFVTTWYWEAEEQPSVSSISQDTLDKNLAKLYNSVAIHYYGQKEYQTALGYFTQAIEIDGEYAQAYFNRASTHSLLNETNQAIADLKKAIQIDSETFKEKAKKDSDFDGLREMVEFRALISE